MHRITSLFMIAVLVSVTSLPMLPKAAVCHAAEANAAHTTAAHAKGMHDMHAHMMHGSTMKMQHTAHDHLALGQQHIEQPKSMHKHQKQLSTAEKGCRIECGCGCNRSMDGLPNLLSPHATSNSTIEIAAPVALVEPQHFPQRPPLATTVPSPPPKLI